MDNLEKQQQPPKPQRKQSALNRFKKNVIGNLTNQAIVQAGYDDLIPIDKIRLLNRAYPIVWEQLILEPLYNQFYLTTFEEQERFKKRKDIQAHYNRVVDELLVQMNSGELDDQQHFKEDLTGLLINAITMAASTFEDGGNEDNDDISNEVNYQEQYME